MKKNLSITLDKSQLNNEAYDWMNISIDDERVGKARCKISGDSITIYSVNIFPEFQDLCFPDESDRNADVSP